MGEGTGKDVCFTRLDLAIHRVGPFRKPNVQFWRNTPVCVCIALKNTPCDPFGTTSRRGITSFKDVTCWLDQPVLASKHGFQPVHCEMGTLSSHASRWFDQIDLQRTACFDGLPCWEGLVHDPSLRVGKEAARCWEERLSGWRSDPRECDGTAWKRFWVCGHRRSRVWSRGETCLTQLWMTLAVPCVLFRVSRCLTYPALSHTAILDDKLRSLSTAHTDLAHFVLSCFDDACRSFVVYFVVATNQFGSGACWRRHGNSTSNGERTHWTCW